MFFAASLVAVVLLYLVGFLLLRAFRFPALFALAGAPIISTLCYEALAVGFDKAGVAASWALLLLPPLALAVVMYVASLAWRRRRKPAQAEGKPAGEGILRGRFDWKMLLLYAGLGLVVGLVVFVKPLDGPECFNQTYDNLTHLGLVRSFVESGHFSSLNASQYWDLGIAGSYYPAAWHMVTAMVCGALGVSNLLATNAMNYICCSLVYPISCLCLMKVLFPEDKAVVAAGAFASIGFVTFPWFFVVYGVLEANLFGFIMVPVMLVSVIKVFGRGVARADRVRYLCSAAASVLFCVFAQPNAFFTVLLFAIPYFAWRIWEETGSAGAKPTGTMARLGVEGGFLLAVLVFWAVCYKAPFLYETTHFVWGPVASKSQAIVNTALFSNSWTPVALVVAFFAIAGAVTMLGSPKRRWIVGPMILSAAIYYVGICMEGSIDQFLSGFWYSDWRRVAALQALAAVPVAAVGIVVTYESVARRFVKGPAVTATCSVLLLLLLFFPNFTLNGIGTIRTPFGYLEAMIQELYGADKADDAIIFSTPEQEFTHKVKDIVGDDVVYNIPYDGSFLAYQVDGLRTVYRAPYTGAGENENQRIIQARLCDYASDDDVREAVDAVGAQYVMMLDYGHMPHHYDWPDYYPENWEGITRIDEATPGFELVLEDGDMRLYRIKGNAL